MTSSNLIAIIGFIFSIKAITRQTLGEKKIDILATYLVDLNTNLRMMMGSFHEITKITSENLENIKEKVANVANDRTKGR